MRKVLTSFGAGPQSSLLRIAGRTFKPYAARHNYDLVLSEDLAAPERPASWSKLPLLSDLAREYDYVLWLDADTMIVDGSLDICDELPANATMALVAHDTPAGPIPNCGVWLLRGGEATVALIDSLWQQTDLIDHPWWENAALLRLMGYELSSKSLTSPTALYKQNTYFLDKRWNSIPNDPAAKPFIRHYPGYKNSTRQLLMLKDLALMKLGLTATPGANL